MFTLEDAISMITTTKTLARFNIQINEFGATFIHNNYSVERLIKDVKRSQIFFLGLDYRDMATLGLAMSHEESGGGLTEYDIKFLNQFFKFEKPITMNDVLEFNKKYI